jgi:hypothetical protein
MGASRKTQSKNEERKEMPIREYADEDSTDP